MQENKKVTADDESVKIDNSKCEIKDDAIDKKQITVCIKFKPKTQLDCTSIAKGTWEMPKMMTRFYKPMVICNNQGERQSMEQDVPHMTRFDQKCKLHHSPGNQEKNRGEMCAVCCRIETSFSLGEMRRHKEVAANLKSCDARITEHHWDESVTKTRSLGWTKNVCPSNHTRSELENDLRTSVATANKTPETDAPKFVLSFSTPFHRASAHKTTRSEACELTTELHKMKPMMNLLSVTFKDAHDFIFHRMRHSNPNEFTQMIKAQTKFLSNQQTAPIEGVTSAMMQHLKPKSLAIDGVANVFRHKCANSKQRWSVMTDEKHCNCVVENLTEGTEAENDAINLKNRIETLDTFKTPTVCVRTRDNHSSADGSTNSCIAASAGSAGSLGTECTNCDCFREPKLPAPQLWGHCAGPSVMPQKKTSWGEPPVNVIATSGTSFSTMSDAEKKEMTDMKELAKQQDVQNETLTDKHDKLAAQLDAMVKPVTDDDKQQMNPMTNSPDGMKQMIEMMQSMQQQLTKSDQRCDALARKLDASMHPHPTDDCHEQPTTRGQEIFKLQESDKAAGTTRDPSVQDMKTFWANTVVSRPQQKPDQEESTNQQTSQLGRVSNTIDAPTNQIIQPSLSGEGSVMSATDLELKSNKDHTWS